MVAGYFLGCAHYTRFGAFAHLLSETSNAFAQRLGSGDWMPLFYIVAGSFPAASQLARRRSERLARAHVKV